MTSIIPVIHYADDEQAMRNAARAFDAGCEGVLLIEMRGRDSLLPDVARAIKSRWEDRLVGVNMLGAEPERALEWSLDLGLDMTWTDEQLTHSSDGDADEARRVRTLLSRHPDHLFFCGVAFKHQRHEPDPVWAARAAVDLGFIPTTSGSATGVAAEVDRIAAIREGLEADAPLGIASGITPENAASFSPFLSHILVATGVSSTFHEFDPLLLRKLVHAVHG